MYECICEHLQVLVVIFVHASCMQAWLYVYLSVRVMVGWCLVAHRMLMWCDVMWCDAMWCDAMWCDVMWRDVTWCDVISGSNCLWDAPCPQKSQICWAEYVVPSEQCWCIPKRACARECMCACMDACLHACTRTRACVICSLTHWCEPMHFCYNNWDVRRCTDASRCISVIITSTFVDVPMRANAFLL